jgi:hypothetical protein
MQRKLIAALTIAASMLVQADPASAIGKMISGGVRCFSCRIDCETPLFNDACDALSSQ